MRIINSYEKLITYLSRKLTNKQFIIFSSILVGLSAGLAAVILKTLVHYIHLAITYDYDLPYQYYIYLLLPMAGIVITVWITTVFFKGVLGAGTSNIHKAIFKKSAHLPKQMMYSHVVTSAVTVALGGSAGLESPIVTTGSAIGSNYSRTYNLGYKDRVLLLACGAAAGIAGAFNAPIAGVLFALEVLLVDATISAFIPLMIAAAVGTLCSKIILQEDILLSFKLQEYFHYEKVHYYVLLGVLAGLVSVYYARMFTKIERFFARSKLTKYKKALIGGFVLAMLILLFPSLFGEGYSSISSLADQQPEALLSNGLFSFLSDNEWFVLLFIGIIMLLKVVATSITINSGGNGGNFAPSLFVGAYLGFFFAKAINLLGFTRLSESNFTAVAMAGILAGVFYAPLTGIFLIAEITGGYELIIPLMLVSATSFMIAKYFEPLSMDAKKLAVHEDLHLHDRDKTILSAISFKELIETDFIVVKPGASLGELVEILAQSSRNIFPVIDDEGKLTGVILLDNIREIMFKTELYDSLKARELMRTPPAIADFNDSMYEVMKKFDETESWNLPVLKNDQFIGFISKSKLLTKYRRQLIINSQ
ncbi:MAG: chloride channel protein [Crocinitomicaceae bacterium]|nr:chloride channel protein [Crocinitomicaceae bacterium]MBK8925093.1 chloride channel protein [Crocinitomicaceae bacterium]